MLLATGLLIAGLVLLIKGADWLVEGASVIARHLRITELAIGLTIVAFGTSLPELTVNIFSSLSGANDIAIGNIVGSNTANILLILGIAAIIAPMSVQTSTVWKEIPLALLAAITLFIMANDQLIDGYAISELSRTDGFTLLAFFLIFLWYIVGMQRIEDGHEKETRTLPIATGMMGVGLLLLVIGGKIAVDGAVSIATSLGVSQALIGLTVVAVGTSLPELATSVVAARKGKADIAIGNIVGSNIFNIFWILGMSSSIRHLTFRPELNIDLLVGILATIILFFVVHTGAAHRRLLFWQQRSGHVIERKEGILMLLVYVAYIIYLGWRG
ncbi:calcium/sodium antiporter [Candidatus Peregrinibacteria bacterium]|nr:calcium/sodium antiporter [Candidatus Peregrinibacteria bacterium]